MNPNTEYEKLVANIYRGILQYEGYKNLRVDHDVTLIGKSGASHQIDVFWEFQIAGTTYRTCIECKNYKSAVKKMHVAAFAEIIRDIGNANGIMATTESFQKGAKLLAQENNVRLVLVNYLIKEIHITSHPIATNYSNVKLNFNDQSIKEALNKAGLEKFELGYNFSGNHYLTDSNGLPKLTFNNILNGHHKKEGENIVENTELYLKIEELGYIKVDSIEFYVNYTKMEPMKSIIESPNSAKAVMEDIVTENIHYIHNDGSVNKHLNPEIIE